MNRPLLSRQKASSSFGISYCVGQVNHVALLFQEWGLLFVMFVHCSAVIDVVVVVFFFFANSVSRSRSCVARAD